MWNAQSYQHLLQIWSQHSILKAAAKSQRDKSWYWWVPHWERCWAQCVWWIWPLQCRPSPAATAGISPCSHRRERSGPAAAGKTQVTLMACLSVLETTGSDWLLLGKTTSTHKPTCSVRLYGSSRRSFGRREFIRGERGLEWTLSRTKSNKTDFNV